MPQEILERMEALASSEDGHLSVVEWFYFLMGGQYPERDIDELLGHVTSCSDCRAILEDIRGRNGR